MWLKTAFKNWLVVDVLTGVNKLICTESTKSDSMSRVDSNANIATLHKLGLTVLEAKVYTSLIATGKSDVRAIARIVDIAKCEVYRAISSLEKIGLVEKILVSPAVYQAISIRDASVFLMENKRLEYKEIQKETEQLVTSLSALEVSNPTREEENDLIISDGKIVARRLADQLQSVRTSYETISTWNVCAKMLSNWHNDFSRLTRNKVQVRVLTDLPKDGLIPQFISDLQKNPFFEIKYYLEPLTIKMAIRDKVEVNICCSEKDFTPNIWSKNPIFAQLANKTFEGMWNTAVPNIEQRNKTCTILPI